MQQKRAQEATKYKSSTLCKIFFEKNSMMQNEKEARKAVISLDNFFHRNQKYKV
jgi:hypothetical protein